MHAQANMLGCATAAFPANTAPSSYPVQKISVSQHQTDPLKSSGSAEGELFHTWRYILLSLSTLSFFQPFSATGSTRTAPSSSASLFQPLYSANCLRLPVSDAVLSGANTNSVFAGRQLLA